MTTSVKTGPSRSTRVLAISAGVVLLSALTACGADGDAAINGISNDITGSLSEWKIDLSSGAASAGTVNFTITNEGTIEHEFVIVKTDIPDGEIPLVEDKFKEDAEGVEVIDEMEKMASGVTETLSVNLEPGNYQLVCNIVSHYGAGMHTSFVVNA